MEKERERVPISLLTLVAGVIITLFSLWFGQNHGLMPEQASEQAPLVDEFFNVMMTIATALFLVVEGAIVIAIFRFRQRKGDDSDADPIQGNLPLEAFWTAIPAIIVIGLGVYSVEVYRDMGGFVTAEPPTAQVAAAELMPASAMAAPVGVNAEAVASAPEVSQSAHKQHYGFGAAPARAELPADVVVEVTGMQFAWIFNYPENGITSGELHVPVGKSVQLNLVAQDVIHSFWVPQFRLKQDVIPGAQTQLSFVATKPGKYPIVCAELCGGYHGAMRSELIVDTPQEYEAWLAQNQLAQKSPAQAIALNPADLSVSEFLTPYAEKLGIAADTVTELSALHADREQ